MKDLLSNVGAGGAAPAAGAVPAAGAATADGGEGAAPAEEKKPEEEKEESDDDMVSCVRFVPIGHSHDADFNRALVCSIDLRIRKKVWNLLLHYQVYSNYIFAHWL